MMWKKGNKKKSEQLGMPHGTASNKLRKSILFNLLILLDLNFCWECGNEIKTEKELSIEHIIPWLDSEDPPGLFFNLENIAFSHLSCNCATSRQPNKIICPEGQAWCPACKRFKDIKYFPKKFKRLSGGYQPCTKCGSKYKKDYRSRTRI